MSETRAKYVCSVAVVDPDSGSTVELAAYKTEGGGMFAVDASFIDGTDGPVWSPFDADTKICSADL